MTTTAPTRRGTTVPASSVRLTAGGILRSEWIKLRSLRSTVWAYALILVIQVAFGLLLVSVTVGRDGFAEQARFAGTDFSTFGATAGVAFGQLVVSVLGVLVISGEYSTGQIRSSFAAVPKRLPVLWAKALIFAVVTFIVSLVSIVLTYALTWPILSSNGITSNLTDPTIFWPLIGAAGYLSLVGVLALGIGAILRSTAGGIAASLGLLLVVPVVFQLIPADWAASIADWLPSSVGMQIYSPAIFEWWQALLIMLGWIVLALGTAATLMRRRDA